MARSYALLARAILERAAEDYIDLTAGFVEPTIDCNLTEIDEFVHSEFFGTLTKVDPDYFIRLLKEKASAMVATHTVGRDKNGRGWFVRPIGKPRPDRVVLYPTQKQALFEAARLSGLTFRELMKIRKRDGVR